MRRRALLWVLHDMKRLRPAIQYIPIPQTIKVRGTTYDRVDSDPVEVAGQHWDTYASETNDHLYERARETGRLIQTRGD